MPDAQVRTVQKESREDIMTNLKRLLVWMALAAIVAACDAEQPQKPKTGAAAAALNVAAASVG